MFKEVIEHGTAKKFKLFKGELIKIIIPYGGQVADITFEGFNQAKTRDALTYVRYGSSESNLLRAMVTTLELGESLYDGTGKQVITLVENHTKATHDLLWPGCSTEVYKDRRKGCRQLLSEILNIPLKVLPAVCTLFMSLDEKNNIIPTPVQLGDYVVLEPLEEMILGVTSCPDTGYCNPNPSEVRVHIRKKIIQK